MRQSMQKLAILAAFTLLCVVFSAQAAEKVKGKIKSVSPDQQEFVLTDSDDKDWKFSVDASAAVQLDDKKVKLQELKAGQKAEITFDKKDGKNIASAIKAITP